MQGLESIAHAGLAAGAEAGEILAHLGVGHARGLAQFAAAHPVRRRLLLQSILHGPQVLAQSTCGRLGNPGALGHGASIP